MQNACFQLAQTCLCAAWRWSLKWSEEKRRDKTRVLSTGAAGVGRCRSPRTQTVLGRGYRADLRRLGEGGTGGAQGLEHYLHASADIEEGGEAYTCTAPTASAPSCHTTDHAPAAAPHHSVLFISAHLTLPFLLFLRNFLVDNMYATRSDTFMSSKRKL